MANACRPRENLTMNHATKPASNLASAKLAVMAAVPYVRKHKAEHLNYSFAGEADLIASLRPAMLAHGLTVAPIGVTVLEQGRYQTLKGGLLNHVVAAVTYRLTHWDVATHEKRASLPSADHIGMVLAYSPDGKRLAMGSLEGLIELWDVGTGQLLDTFKGHGGDIRSIAFTSDGAR